MKAGNARQSINAALPWIQNLSFVYAVRGGLVLILPILMTGSFALILRSLPIPAYQAFIASFAGGFCYDVFDMAYKATFGMLSVYMAAAIGYLAGAPMVSVAAFLLSVGFLTDSFQLNALSAVGMFSAILCGALAPWLYKALAARLTGVRLFTDGSDPALNRALTAIVPAGLVILLFALANAFIYIVSGIPNFHALIARMFDALFGGIGGDFWGGLLYILLSSLLWFFGVHGSDVLESVNQSIFIPAARLNEAAVAAGQVPTVLYTKTFFDVFVLIGGCGTLLSLLVALLLFSRRQSNRSLAGMAALPMLFNINELMVFGLPTIYNPILLVPFVAAPLASFLLSSAAMAAGLVPLPAYPVEWTTPILLGGWQATGSPAGAVLQFVNLVAGVLIYMPFVRRYDRVKEREASRHIGGLVEALREAERANAGCVLTEIEGTNGDIAKHLVNELRQALDKDELFMQYQPQFDRNDRMIGAEALLRWKHSSFGPIYPPLIIKLAGESGQLLDLEKYVFRRVKADAATFPQPIKISVNVSAVSIRDAEFLDFLVEEFPEARAGQAQICVEITEQSELVADARMDEMFARLKRHGFLLAIDDFSMGFTSLKYLSENRFDVVKLDGSLVRGLNNPRNRDIIASIVYLSQSLHFSVLAEFVETAEQRDSLAEIGCCEYQGYLFSPAVSREALLALCRAGQK